MRNLEFTNSLPLYFHACMHSHATEPSSVPWDSGPLLVPSNSKLAPGREFDVMITSHDVGITSQGGWQSKSVNFKVASAE